MGIVGLGCRPDRRALRATDLHRLSRSRRGEGLGALGRRRPHRQSTRWRGVHRSSATAATLPRLDSASTRRGSTSSANWITASVGEQNAGLERSRDFSIDCEITGIDVTPELCQALDQLEPSGQGNPAPLLRSAGRACSGHPRSDRSASTSGSRSPPGRDRRGDRLQQAESCGSPSARDGSSTRASAWRSTRSRGSNGSAPGCAICGPRKSVSLSGQPLAAAGISLRRLDPSGRA